MNEIFSFRGSEVRTATVGGEPMFCLADVCKVLEIGNPSQLKTRLNEKGVITNDTLTAGGVQSLTFINEQNLYKTIFQSRKPEAEAFADWVTGEVLPAIRKQGGYMVAAPEETPEELALRAMKVLEATVARQKLQLEAANKQIEADAPKVAFVNSFCCSQGDILTRDYAKMLANSIGLKGFGQDAMFTFLEKNGYLNLNHAPTQRSTELGVIRMYENVRYHNDGRSFITKTPRITPKGQNYFYGKVQEKYNEIGRWW